MVAFASLLLVCRDSSAVPMGTSSNGGPAIAN